MIKMTALAAESMMPATIRPTAMSVLSPSLAGGVAVDECGDDLPHKGADRRERTNTGQDAQDGVHLNDEGDLLDLRGAGDAGVEFVSIHTPNLSRFCCRLQRYAADLLKDRTNVPIAAM